jgi:UDPglucose--hexose-1-phosphate uridylyltransferase
MNAPTPPKNLPAIYQNRPARGIARVVCYSPRHDLSLAQLEIDEIENLISTWQGEYVALGNRAEIDHVLIFENKGEVVRDQLCLQDHRDRGKIERTLFV